MTSALLRRSRTFVQVAGAPVKILTFDPGLDVGAVRAELEGRGELVPGVTLHNVWEDLRELPDIGLRARAAAEPQQLPQGDSGELVRIEPSADGRPRRRVVFRHDRTVAAIDERTATGRRVTAYTRDGRQGRTWKSVWAVYRSWIEEVLPEKPTFVIVDSKTMTQFFAALRRPGIYTAQLVHGAHLAASATDPHGPLTRTRVPLIEHIDDFDAVVLLTEGQRRDVLDRVGPRDNAFVVPNSTDLPDVRHLARADPTSGAMLASLSRRKRVGHAIRGVQRASARTGLDIGLDIYGDGPDRERLEGIASKASGVALHGFVRGAADRLAEASFLLLTSRAEGLPLVFAEAMSRGCVPIAYDIRYGPADIIIDGVNGFLVPSGDIDALADMIARFVTLDDVAMHEMREAARRTAQEFSSESVVARWAAVFADEVRRRPQPGPPLGEPPGPRPARVGPFQHLAAMLRRSRSPR